MAKGEATLLIKIKEFGGKVVDKVLDKIVITAGDVVNAFSTLGGKIIEVVEAFAIQEEAVNRLNQAMVNTGDFTTEASRDLQEFASQLQQVSIHGDEAIINMLALAKSFGVSNERAKEMVKAATELSAATGQSLEFGVRNLGKSLSGLSGELGESVKGVRDLTAEQLKAGAAIDLVNEKMKGAALAQTKGLGAIKQAKNAWGDFFESLGEKSSGLVSDLAVLTKGFAEFLTPKDSKLKETLTEVNLKISETEKKIKELKSAASGGGFIDELFKFKGLSKARELEEELEALKEHKAKIEEQERKSNENLLVIESTAAQKKIEEKQALRNEELEADLEFISLSADQKTELELQKELEANAIKLDTAANHEQKMLAMKQRADLLQRKRQVKEDQIKVKNEQAFQRARVSIISGASNLITALGKEGSLAVFLAQKAAALASAIVATNLAAAQALAVPPAPNVGLAGAAKLAGGLNIAAIAATTLKGLAEGGIVQASAGGTPALIGEGGSDEAVIPLDDEEALQKIGGLGGVTINFNGPMLGDQSQAESFARLIDEKLFELRQTGQSIAFDGETF